MKDEVVWLEGKRFPECYCKDRKCPMRNKGGCVFIMDCIDFSTRKFWEGKGVKVEIRKF